MQLKNLLVVYTDTMTSEQRLTLKLVKTVLKKYKLNHEIVHRNKLSKAKFHDKDLVIAVGGDGTFLRTAHFVNKQILFGINADVKNTEGFFMKSNKKDFDKKLKKVIHNELPLMKFPRLKAYINNKKLENLALNEFYLGPRKSYRSAKYILNIKGIKERQKSSGILITTPAGSHAWARACCNRTLPLNSKNYQVVVREPYQGKLFVNYKLKYSVLMQDQKTSVTSEMLDGLLIADSVGKEYKLKYGDKVAIELSDDFIRVIWPK